MRAKYQGVVTKGHLPNNDICVGVCTFDWFYILKLLFIFTLQFYHVYTLLRNKIKVKPDIVLHIRTCFP